MKKTEFLVLAIVFAFAPLFVSYGNKSNNAPSGTVAGKAVDLGLSVKWASCNVGADAPHECGGYYAWGETEEKSDYSCYTYKWYGGYTYVTTTTYDVESYDAMTKYSTDSIFGTVDNKTTLEPEDDVAHVKWGAPWRMPTLDEIRELVDKCTWVLTSVNGVYGYTVTGPNGNSIFLPFAGCRLGDEVDTRGLGGFYWSSALHAGNSNYAYCLGFDGGDNYWNDAFRDVGHSVRPVCE